MLPSILAGFTVDALHKVVAQLLQATSSSKQSGESHLITSKGLKPKHVSFRLFVLGPKMAGFTFGLSSKLQKPIVPSHTTAKKPLKVHAGNRPGSPRVFLREGLRGPPSFSLGRVLSDLAGACVKAMPPILVPFRPLAVTHSSSFNTFAKTKRRPPPSPPSLRQFCIRTQKL